MARSAGAPGSQDGRATDNNSREGGTGQHHKGWKARERSGAAAASSADYGTRSPLKEAPGNDAAPPRGNGNGNSNRNNLRPYDIPYASSNAGGATEASASGKVLAGTEDKGITLRCMYTSQKTKKRKTWSDGAVKCCPKRQRVSLYRWSEALGVTEKLLGETYLTVPQYEAFVNQGEPELEMELFIVSLEGVIQPDSDPSTGTASAAAGVSSSDGTAGVGKKRKLFKAFKPPSRRTPPSAPPSGDTWGLPPGRMDQLRNGDRNGDHRMSSGARGDGGREMMMMPPRTSYTGFGHVESLWDDDEEEGGEEGQDRREDGVGSVGLAGEGNAGWGMGAGASCRSAYDGSGGGSRASMFPSDGSEGDHPQQQQQRMQSSSAPPAAAGNASDWMWGQEEHARHVEMHSSSSSGSRPPRLPSRSASCAPGEFDFAVQQQERPRYEDSAHSGQDDPSSYLESLRSGDGHGDGGGGTCPSSAGRSAQRGEAQGVDDGAGGHRHHYYPDHQQFDGSVRGRGAGAEGEPFERNTAVSEYGVGVRAPEVDREPAGGGDDNGGIGGKLRSTQDILSLFGGFGGSSSTTTGDVTGHGAQGPREQEETAATPPLLESRGPNEMPPLEPGVTEGAHMPAGGGIIISRAADMRRAQKAARAVAGVATTGQAAALSTAAEEEGGGAPATSGAGGGVSSADWACGVCGVRGGASSTSCRVCGAKRQQAPQSYDGDVGRGDDDYGDGHHGGGPKVVVGSDKQRGWGGDDFHGGGGGGEWEGQGWEGVAADNDNGHAGGGVQDDDDDLGVGGVETVLPQGQSVMGRSYSTSPSRRPFSHTGGEGGSDGATTGSTPGASSKHRTVGVRMQMDMGSSSDSDDA